MTLVTSLVKMSSRCLLLIALLSVPIGCGKLKPIALVVKDISKEAESFIPKEVIEQSIERDQSWRNLLRLRYADRFNSYIDSSVDRLKIANNLEIDVHSNKFNDSILLSFSKDRQIAYTARSSIELHNSQDLADTSTSRQEY